MKYKVFICLTIIGLLPSCGRVMDWGINTFEQGNKVEQFDKIPQRYVRYEHVYDQLTTEAIFDALWLSDEVRTAYTNVHAQRFGKNEEQHNAFLRRQLAENDHYITFYVLSLYTIPLNPSDSQWGIFLQLDNNQYEPLEVKEIDLNPEYKQFFGKRFTRFKQEYQIKFAAKDLNDTLLITPNSEVKLIFRSLKKEVTLVWNIDEKGCVKEKVLKKVEMHGQPDHKFDMYEYKEV